MTTTPTLKSGQPGTTKVQYGDVDAAAAWLWKFVDGATSAGELYGRVLVVFAAQHYARDLVLPTSQRRGSVLPHSRSDIARKAFERVTKSVLPATHVELRRALEREARDYAERQDEIRGSDREARSAGEPDPDADAVSGAEDAATSPTAPAEQAVQQDHAEALAA